MPFSCKDNNGFKSVDLITAHILRRERENENMSVNFLADVLGISASHLSAIELGKKKPSNELLITLSKNLGVELSMDTNVKDSSADLLNKVLKYLVYNQSNMLVEMYNNIKEKEKNILYYSSGLIEYLLSICISAYMLNELNEVKDSIDELNILEKISSLEHRKIIYLLNGVYYKELGDYEKASEYYSKSKVIVSENDCINGYLSLKLAEVHCLLDKNIEGFKECECAIAYMTKVMAFDFLVYANAIKASILVNENEEDAISIFKSLLLIDEIYPGILKNHKLMIYNNMSYGYMLNKNYSKSIIYTKLALEINDEINSIKYQVPYCYWKLCDEDNALLEISKLKINTKTIEWYIITLIKKAILHNDIEEDFKIFKDIIKFLKPNRYQLFLKEFCFDLDVYCKESLDN
ncbi:helix-turn-helix domain-containing protein [Anaerorhabdus sp.]|uniref:helix-turn-helix domain-containing protein n=1 Tax=Anaerorhabdus sp. TaxID=1872524 RepID=UPI002FC631FD